MATEGPPLSPTDKKRNKLGYHRTAVACGHCRRRKIRCIPAFEDPTGRCQNCIRLKKECQFFPVDQQTPPPGAKRLRKPADGFMNESETSVSSSPAGGILRSSSFEHMEHLEDPLDTPPLPKGSPGFQYQQGPRSFSAHGLDYTHQYDLNAQQQASQPDYLSAPYSSQSIRNFSAEQTNPQFYNQYPPPQQPQYAPTFSPASLPSGGTTLSREDSYSYPSATPNGYVWGQTQQHPSRPTRSLSSGDPSDSSQGFGQAFRTHTYPSFDRQATGDVQQHSSAVSMYHPVATEGQIGPVAAQYREPSSYQPMQTWSSLGANEPGHMGRSGLSAYPSQWYSHHGLGDVREEEDPSAILHSQGRLPHSQHRPG